MRQFLLLLAIWVGGCTSTPQASRERDAEAKQFGSSPAVSTVYVYRPDPGPDEAVLWIDGQLIGSTLPHSFFRVHLDPGGHIFSGFVADNGRLALETRPGEVYFVEQTVLLGQSHFRSVPAESGRKVITNCCSLLENWAPGQRPLLR